MYLEVKPYGFCDFTNSSTRCKFFIDDCRRKKETKRKRGKERKGGGRERVKERGREGGREGRKKQVAPTHVP
jgi:hypothetical protein